MEKALRSLRLSRTHDRAEPEHRDICGSKYWTILVHNKILHPINCTVLHRNQARLISMKYYVVYRMDELIILVLTQKPRVITI